MWFPQNFASSASPRLRSATGFPASLAACRDAIGAAFGLALRIARMARPTPRHNPAQDEALANLQATLARKMDLRIQQDRLAADRRQAVRDHKATCSIDRQLKAVVAELLRIG